MNRSGAYVTLLEPAVNNVCDLLNR